jgi:hypothetical protein
LGQGVDGERFAARLPGKLRPERQYGYDERARRTYLVAPDSTHVMLEANLDGSTVSIGMCHVDLSQFPLRSRGFHWISEFPFNR